MTIKTYLVGGAVRDKLLGLPVHERDWVVVGATPQDMLDQGYQQVGKDFPVFLHPDTGEEYALARTERKTGSGYTGFTCYAAPDVTLEDDLKRRDLTINAIALDENDQLIDPYGGQKDLQAKILRHVSEAFVEDPLRVLRIARFNAKLPEFVISEETQILLNAMVRNGEVDNLVPERVWTEITKALAYSAPDQFFMRLQQCGALQILLPEINSLFGLPGAPDEYPKIDLGLHALRAVRCAAEMNADPELQFACLFADISKTVLPPIDWPLTSEGSFDKSVYEKLFQRLPVPRHYQNIALQLGKWYPMILKANFDPTDLLKFFNGCDAFRRPEQCHAVLLGSKIILQSRFADTNFKAIEKIEKILKNVAAIDVQKIIQAGHQGDAIKKALDAERLKVIADLM